MADEIEVAGRVRECLGKFFQSLGRDIPVLEDQTDLITGTGASSDEGVDFAIDLEEALGVAVPGSFNPFVHESGRRGMRVGELIDHATKLVETAKEAHHAQT